MMQQYSGTNYFKIYSEADENHALMVAELLDNLTDGQHTRLQADSTIMCSYCPLFRKSKNLKTLYH